MLQFSPYLSFDGNCAQAMLFYERTLGGKLEASTKYTDTPDKGQVPSGSDDRIMHARLVLPGGAVLMAGDSPAGQPYSGMSGISLTLTYPTAAEADVIFKALAVGGKVSMPLQQSFWAEVFGMVVDRFGTPWIVNGAMKL